MTDKQLSALVAAVLSDPLIHLALTCGVVRLGQLSATDESIKKMTPAELEALDRWSTPVPA